MPVAITGNIKGIVPLVTAVNGADVIIGFAQVTITGSAPNYTVTRWFNLIAAAGVQNALATVPADPTTMSSLAASLSEIGASEASTLMQARDNLYNFAVPSSGTTPTQAFPLLAPAPVRSIGLPPPPNIIHTP